MYFYGKEMYYWEKQENYSEKYYNLERVIHLEALLFLYDCILQKQNGRKLHQRELSNCTPCSV